MNLLDRIRNSRQKSVLPQEVKEYYQTTDTRQRRGVAIVLAILALLATIAIAAALFFGGRFAYNKIAGNDDNQNAGTSQTEETDGFGGTGNQEQGQQPVPGSNPPSTPSPGDQAPGAPAPTPGTPPAQTNPTTPALGDTPLPRTGDEGM